MVQVLLVDDSDEIRYMAKRVLSVAGFNVTLATAGNEALELAAHSVFDAAVVDYDIPPPNGLDLLDRLRRMQPNCVRILMSGELNVSVVLDAVNRGEIARMLSKPFDADTLPRAIEDALEMRQRNGESYAHAMAEAAESEGHALRECLHSDVLSLALQPIVHASGQRTFGFEALLRSSHVRLNSPPALLSAAERHAQIAALGGVVVERAASWMPRLPTDARLFVNLHPAELGDPEGLTQRLERLAPWSDRIVLEITERSSLAAIQAWERSARAVESLGFSIAVDDVGAGYSSLAVLAELKPRFMKVDMSIIRGIHNDPHKQNLLDLLCKFASATNAHLVAEGIETPEEASVVIDAGAPLLQGYLYGRPSHELPEPAV